MEPLVINKIKERRAQGAVCPKCRLPDYKYLGRVDSEFIKKGKHQFQCNGCKHTWQYGYGDSNYLTLR